MSDTAAPPAPISRSGGGSVVRIGRMDPDVANLSSVVVSVANSTIFDDQLALSPAWNLLELISIGCVLVIIILSCVIGNLFVIMAILFERDLRRPQ